MEVDQAFYALFDQFNRELFSENLEKPRVCVNVHKGSPCKWVAQGNLFVIGADAAEITLFDFRLAMLHEMVHMINNHDRKSDSSINQYHNKYFFEAASKAGLYTVRHQKCGWALLSTSHPRDCSDASAVKPPTQESHRLLMRVISNPALSRQQWASARRLVALCSSRVRKPKSFLLKYECDCPPPHNSIRSGRRPGSVHALEVYCKKCRSDFKCVL